MPHVHFDHSDPAISSELFAWRERLERDSKIAYSDALGGFWVASRYQDVVQIIRNDDAFTCSKGVTLPPQKSPVPVIPLEADEPDHSIYRAAFMPFVGAGPVAKAAVRIREIVSEAIDNFVAGGGGDAVSGFAALIPTRAMAMIFGFDDADAHQFDAGFSALVSAAGGDVEQQNKAVESFRSFLMQKIEQGRASPSDNNLIAALLRFDKNGRKFTVDECLGMMWSAAGGAIDTTKIGIGHLIQEIGRNPEVRRQLIENPSLIPKVVDESLRLNASAFMDARHVVKDITICGVDMKVGDRVLLVYGLANRDEAMFSNPHELRLDRKTNPHLTFGQGIHMCVGMHLARLELKIVVEEWLRRFPDYELVEPDAQPILHGGMMWSYDTQLVRLPTRN